MSEGQWLTLTMTFFRDYPQGEDLAQDEHVVVEGIPFPVLAHASPRRERTLSFRIRGPLPPAAQYWLNYQKGRAYIADWSLTKEGTQEQFQRDAKTEALERAP